jgi:hypothetical protein
MGISVGLMNVVTVRLGVRRMLKYAAHRFRGEVGSRAGSRADLGYIPRVIGTLERRPKGL